MFELVNVNNGKTITRGTMHSLERLQERIDPLGLNTEIVDDRKALYEPKVATMIDDDRKNIFASMNRKPTVRDLDCRPDGFMLFVINDIADRVEILQKHDDLLVVRVNDANLREKIIKNGYEHDGRVYKFAFATSSQARANAFTLKFSPDGAAFFIVDDTEWTNDEMKAYESHPSLIQNTHLKNIIRKTCDSRIEKLNCARIPHLDRIHHKSTIDNITILHQVDFPVCDD